MALLLGVVLGCESEQVRTSYKDEGTVCLRLQGAGTLHVRVRFPTCLSSSCNRALETGCQLTTSGTTLDLTSHGASETTGETTCTDDCGALMAECDSTELVEPGEYLLNHGSDSESVSLSREEVCAFGRGFP